MKICTALKRIFCCCSSDSNNVVEPVGMLSTKRVQVRPVTPVEDSPPVSPSAPSFPPTVERAATPPLAPQIVEVPRIIEVPHIVEVPVPVKSDKDIRLAEFLESQAQLAAFFKAHPQIKPNAKAGSRISGFNTVPTDHDIEQHAFPKPTVVMLERVVEKTVEGRNPIYVKHAIINIGCKDYTSNIPPKTI